MGGGGAGSGRLMSGTGTRNSLATVSDEELLVRAGAGDRGAFMELHDRFAPRILGLLVKIMRNRTEAEDALQNVALDLWRRAGGFDPALGSAQTWILMVARARGIDALRRSSRFAATGIEAAQPGVLDPPRAEVAGPRRVDVALAALPPEQRTPIDMAFYRGLTREQIAGALDIPVGTVKTRIRMGLQRLGVALAEREGGVA
jgi:RNA polymerase sigma-70 factor (ECF subfamily)